jgi:hypothetical protein
MSSDTFPDRFAQKNSMTTSTRTFRTRSTPNGTPAASITSQPSRSPPSSPSPLANKSHAPPQNSMYGWNMCQTMCLAGGTGLEQVIAAAVDAMPQAGLPVASERAGRDGRRAGLKRTADEITRSDAEDFALLTIRTSFMRYAADFLIAVASVANVSFRDICRIKHLNTSKLSKLKMLLLYLLINTKQVCI